MRPVLLGVVTALGGISAAPSRTSAPVATMADSLTTTYVVDGIRVVQRRTNVSTVIANVYLLGGVRAAPAGLAGIENFLLQVSERGTTRYPRDVLRRAVARTGAEIVVEPREDWTMFGVRTTATELDSAWAIFADRLVHPRLAAADVEFVRDQMLAGIRQRADSPDALLEYVADSTAYAGSPYALSSVGTEESLARATREDLVEFHKTTFTRSRMVLVVVGNIDRAGVERLLRGTLTTLPAGTYTWTLPDTLPSAAPAATIVGRPLPTNYIQGYFRGPPASSTDAAALRVASAVLSGRLFGEIRSRRNLTYAVSANYRDRALTSIGLYVTTTMPDSVLGIMGNEIRALQTFEIPTDFLRPVIQQFITEYFLDNETSAAQADFLARAYLYRGDATAGERFVAELRGVTGADIRRVAQLYFRNASWAYIGDPASVTRARMLRF
jgi:zinc protease